MRNAPFKNRIRPISRFLRRTFTRVDNRIKQDPPHAVDPHKDDRGDKEMNVRGHLVGAGDSDAQQKQRCHLSTEPSEIERHFEPVQN